MKYCRLENGVVIEIFDYNPFEWIPNDAFLANCFECQDEVQQGWIRSAGIFVEKITLTPQQQREKAYEELLLNSSNEPLILWENNPITVDQANKVFFEYSAENNSKASDIQALIIEAKAYIRSLYPDE